MIIVNLAFRVKIPCAHAFTTNVGFMWENYEIKGNWIIRPAIDKTHGKLINTLPDDFPVIIERTKRFTTITHDFYIPDITNIGQLKEAIRINEPTLKPGYLRDVYQSNEDSWNWFEQEPGEQFRNLSW